MLITNKVMLPQGWPRGSMQPSMLKLTASHAASSATNPARFHTDDSSPSAL